MTTEAVAETTGKYTHVRTIYRSRSQSDAARQSRGAAIQSRVHRDGAYFARAGERRLGRGGERFEESRCRSAEDSPGGGEAGPERSRDGDDGEAATDPTGEE